MTSNKLILIGLMLVLSNSAFADRAEEIRNNPSCDPCGVTADQRACVKKECKTKIVTKTVFKEVIKEVPVEVVVIKEVEKKAKIRKNRISLLAGRSAKQGLVVQNNTNNAQIESKVGAVIGLQYQRLITERVSLGAEALTSKAALISIGYDFLSNKQSTVLVQLADEWT